MPRTAQLLAALTFALLAAPAVASADNGYFRQSGGIAINDLGPATPYPSQNVVSGLTGQVARVTVQFGGLAGAFQHADLSDVDLLLVGPQGQKAMILSDVGGRNAANLAVLMLDDGAPFGMPASGVGPGAFKPTDLEPGDVLNDPAPAGPYPSALSTFNGTDPNGTWKLFAQDDVFNGTGSLPEWSLYITTAQASSGGGGGGGTGGGGTTTNPPDPDTTRATIESCTVRRQSIRTLGRVVACLRASERGRFTASGILRAGTHSFTLAPVSVTLTRPVHQTTLRITLSRTVRAAVTAARADHKSVTVSLQLSHADAAGNTARTRASVTAR
jgi:hypothetical protein